MGSIRVQSSTFTTELANRTTRERPLTLADAPPFGHNPHGLLTSNRSTGAICPSGRLEVAEAGFKFAEFEPEYGRYRLSKPYELVVIPERNSLTIRQ